VKDSQERREYDSGHTVEKQDNAKLTAFLFFVFDFEVKWGASIND